MLGSYSIMGRWENFTNIMCWSDILYNIIYIWSVSDSVYSQTYGFSWTKNTLMVKNGFNYMQKMTHRHWYKIYIYKNSLKRLNGFGNRLPIVFDWNVTSKIRDRRVGRVKYKFRKKIILWNARNTVFVAVANDLLIILRGKGLLFNLKDTAILYDLLNLLLWLESLETSIELNIDSARFRFPFSTRCNLFE